MRNIIILFLLTASVSCFGQTYGYMISKDPAQDADTANVLVGYPTGNGNRTGRSHFVSYSTLADSIGAYISASISDGDKGDITVTGGITWTIDNNAITNAKILNDAVDASKIAPDAVGSSEINASSVGTSELQATTVTAASYVYTSLIVDEDGRITSASNGAAVSPADTSSMLSNYISRSDTASMLLNYLREQGYYWIDRHGAISNDGLDDRVAIQALLDYVESIGGGVVVVPIGVFNITYNAIREGLYIGDNTTLLGFGSGSEIRYTGHATLSSTAIQNRRSSGQYSDFQQRTGNENIHIQGIKLSFTERDDFKNIGINLSGVLWGSIKDTWVDSCGGYSYLIGRTNDTDTIGNFSKNIILENLKVTNMMDVGLEIWGAENVTANNLDISGRGVDTGYGNGIYVWNGAKNVHIYNAKIEKDTNDFDAVNRYMVAFAVGGIPYGDTITGAIKTQNITFENVTSRTDQGFRINILNDVVPLHRVDSVFIRNCQLLGYDTIRNASDIRHCKTLVIEGCTFDRFARHLQFSTTSNTTQQNSVSDVTIRDNSFTWGEGIDFHGITDFNIYDNRFYYIFDQAPITVRGGRNGIIKNNYFFNIGNGTDQWCITLNKLTASLTRDTRLIEVTGNTACDNRASKNTDDLITMYDATDSITVKFNVLDCADTDADQYSNIGTGTAIFIDNNIEVSDTASMLSTYLDRSSAETIYGVKTFNADPIVQAEAYAVGWNGSNEPPTKNDVYDKIETLSAGSGHTILDDGAAETARTGLNFVSTSTINMIGTDDLANNETEIAANVIAGSIGDTELGSGLDATQLADGTVTSAELQYINTLTSNAQTQLTGKFTLAGLAGGQTAIGGTGTTDDLILQSTSGVGATGALIQMKVGNNGGTTAMTILNDGKVGLGTVSPTSRLDVTEAASGSIVHFGPSTGGGYMSAFGDGTAYQSVGAEFTGGQWIARSTGATHIGGNTGVFQFYTNNGLTAGVSYGPTERMCIQPSGKIGIATTTPDKQFEINLGTAEAFRLTYNDNNGSAANYMDATISSTGSPTFNAVGTSPLFNFSDGIVIPTATPANASATGTTGQIAWDADYIYVCTATNTWKRVSISSW